ncbi:LytTR family transcriptional regulator DNA-binding domain-containing protein [Larkinella sp. VNQ87]|uniref:LytTR family transcriptional regulator DNA-binding domain-containing protein n=1 Tax=Larkinella sp. VNQ87 TaxID=3400921 RepID=UPI003C015850
MLSITIPVLQQSVDLLNILYLHNDGPETWMVYFDNSIQQCTIVPESLTHWEKLFPDFWRINESYLINPALIYRFHPADLPHFPLPLIEMVTGRTLAISPRKTKQILQKWEQKQPMFSA